jgi:uncharacterized membrane protein YjjP (DUF1212 family)
MPAHHLIPKIIDIGDTLHRSGCAPYKLEKYVEHYALSRGIEATVQATPTSINYQFFDEDNTVVMKRLKPASIDMTLLAHTINQITRDDESISAEPKQYPRTMQALANIAIPPAYLMLVGSTYHALASAACLGLLVWMCQQVFTGRRSIAVEFISALVVGISAAFLNSLGLHISVWSLCIASILLFVPGLSISNALECLAFNDLVSGTSLLGQCVLTLIKLFTGIFMGLSIGSALWTTSVLAYTNEFPIEVQILGLPLLSLCLSIIFNVRPRDIVRGAPVAIMGMWGPTLLHFENGWVVATWLTSVAIGLYGTWIAKIRDLTGSIYIVQGIIIMVPGSRVLVSASQPFYEASILPIPSVGESAMFMFAAIVVGQITAYSIYSPKIER